MNSPELDLLAGRLPPGSDLQAGMDKALVLALRFGVSIEEVLPGATNCLILGGHDSDGAEVVGRIRLCDEEAGAGFRPQLAFSGRGGVEVLDHDVDTGATLMPRIRPGEMLHAFTIDPREETLICSEVIRALDHRSEERRV